jgi:hypothetical protein
MPSVATQNPTPKGGPSPINPGDPMPTAPNEIASKPSTSVTSKLGPDTSSPTDSAPIGTVTLDPTKPVIVSVPADGPKVAMGDTKKYFVATLSLPVDQLETLGAKYTIQDQNGEPFISVPTIQFVTVLKQGLALPGASQVGKTEEKDITQGVAQATESAKQSKDTYDKLLGQYQRKSPAEQAEMKPQLESAKQEMLKDQANLDSLSKQADTSIILLKVLGR